MWPAARAAPSRSNAPASEAARPLLAPITALCGRITGSGRNWASSRKSRGHSPARRNDGLPRARRPEDHQQMLDAAFDQTADAIEPAHDPRVAPKKHRCVCGSSALRPR